MVTEVAPHDPRWKTAFENEAKTITHVFAPLPVQVHHIGSTAVPDILAKPIVDLNP
ncbi:MAG: GrpB family protein [Pseudomonadota bacterium]